jgi:tripartite-type tricarboxylate transporter receptor subunit TctC
MIAPGGTPPAIVASLNSIATAAINDPAVKEKLADQGLTVVGDAPEHFRGFIARESAKWAKVIRDAGLATTR